jgi:hypothetical protein
MGATCRNWAHRLSAGARSLPSGYITTPVLPQWSPPTIDASTGRVDACSRGTRPVAAMEPAVEQRELTNAIFTALDALWEPQWSPPLIGRRM